MTTKIEWVKNSDGSQGETWNPVTGCEKVSQGCKNCYAEREWSRMVKLVPSYAGRKFTDVRTHSDRLDKPLRWSKPRTVFVNSMSDLFHPDVDETFILAVFSTMAKAKQHTFQILTKRPERMREMLTRWVKTGLTLREGCGAVLPNVHLGVSIEDQPTADARIAELIKTPAAVRWISAEPLLGAVDFRKWIPRGAELGDKPDGFDNMSDRQKDEIILTSARLTYIARLEIGFHWVVVGGESGPNARPMNPAWVRSIRDQCAAAGVPFMFKQHGEWIHDDDIDLCTLSAPEIADADQYFQTFDWPDGTQSYRVGKKHTGRLLDGVQHDGDPK